MDHDGACACAECEELDLIETRQRSEAAALLGRRGGLKGGRATGACKRRGDSDHYRAIRRRDYVADRRQYRQDGRRDYTSGGWAVMRWDARREVYVEPMAYHRSRREALDALRESR